MINLKRWLQSIMKVPYHEHQNPNKTCKELKGACCNKMPNYIYETIFLLPVNPLARNNFCFANLLGTIFPTSSVC